MTLNIQFGPRALGAAPKSLHIVRQAGADPGSEMVLALSDALAAGVDFRGQVVIERGPSERGDPLFVGQVVTADVQGDLILLHIATGSELVESLMGGMSARGVHPLELAWSIARHGGLPEHRIQIAGFEPGPLELFEVIVPLDGVRVESEIRLAGIRLLPPEPAARLVRGLGPESLRQRYETSSVFAIALESADTLVDAEVAGLSRIDFFLAWLMLRAHYSSVTDPNGQVREYQRSNVRSRPRRRDAVLVRGLTTQRTWLRAPSTLLAEHALDVRRLSGLELLPPPDAGPQLQEAVAAWRRAEEIDDPIGRVTALSEAIEFYAAGFTAETTFSKSELAAVRHRAEAALDDMGLGETHRRRLRDVLSQLKAPSLLMRLDSAMLDDRVPITEQELEVLSRIRRVRNDFVHGRSRSLPDATDLDYATAVVNRLLTYRIARVAGMS